MAAWTTPITYPTGDSLQVSAWNGVANDETFLYQAPYGLYYNSVSQSITNNVQTTVTLGGIEAQNYGFSISSNTVSVPLTGIYMTYFCVGVAANVTLRSGVFVGGQYARASTHSGQAYSSSANGFSMLSLTAGANLNLSTYCEAIPPTTNASKWATYLHAYFVGSV